MLGGIPGFGHSGSRQSATSRRIMRGSFWRGSADERGRLSGCVPLLGDLVRAGEHELLFLVGKYESLQPQIQHALWFSTSFGHLD
jgi:hypothetical protein